MPAHHRLTASSAILLMALLVLLPACGDDDDDCPTCPDEPGPPAPTIQNVWPHADGNTWIHDLTVHGFDGDPADVVDPDGPDPELPTMEELHARLQEPVPFDPRGSSEGLYRLRFDGEVTTDSGVTAQHLREEVYTPAAGKRLLAPREERLRELVLALRGGGRTDPAKDAGDQLDPPILMGGYAFEATDTGIYSYGDLNTEHSWIYLEGELAVGDEFSIQLVPDIADDIFLYGRIWSVGDLEIAGTTYANSVECFYVIDMGIATATDEDGNELHEQLNYIYGSIFYAPGVGPVRCHQRMHSVGGDFLIYEPVILDYEASISGLAVSTP